MTAELHMDRRLPASEVYACSKKEAKAAFTDMDDVVVHFGEETHFEFDKGVHHPPALTGTVVASATIDREGVTSVGLYPIRKDDYADHEHAEFVAAELTKLRKWIEAEHALPETQIVANRQLILESVVDGFREHEVHFA